MARGTEIEWTEATWNPITGCTKVSAGCRHCYAERMAVRLQAMGQPNYANGFKLTLQPRMLSLPLTWKRPLTIFVNSMSDLFHPDVPFEYVQDVFAIMEQAYWHRFQVLTKRADRLESVSKQLNWSSNVWMGVSVEHSRFVNRIDHLRCTGAAVKFLSLEPLLGPLPKLDLRGIDWVIVGGESGPGARPLRAAWVTEIRDQCIDAEVPFFFKQWGGTRKKLTGRTLDGETWSQMPAELDTCVDNTSTCAQQQSIILRKASCF